MDHFYQNIYGWFDYQELYKNVINTLPEGSRIVEIGAFKGKSTAFLAVEAINSGKKFKIDIIDSWNGENESGAPWMDYHDEPVVNQFKPQGDIFQEFKKNLLPVCDVINPIQSLSAPAASLYKDKSLDFIFIDADHNYEGIKKDLIAWIPKMKDGATMAGHDYTTWKGVETAVNEFFGKRNVTIIESSWIVKL